MIEIKDRKLLVCQSINFPWIRLLSLDWLEINLRGCDDDRVEVAKPAP